LLSACLAFSSGKGQRKPVASSSASIIKFKTHTYVKGGLTAGKHAKGSSVTQSYHQHYDDLRLFTDCIEQSGLRCVKALGSLTAKR